MKQNNHFANIHQQSPNNFQDQLQGNLEIQSPYTPQNIPNRYLIQPNLALNTGSPTHNIGDDVTDDLIRTAQMFEGNQLSSSQPPQDVISHGFTESYMHHKIQGYTDQDIDQLVNSQRLNSEDPEQEIQEDEQIIIDYQNMQRVDTGFGASPIPNYEIEFNFEGFNHQELVERNLNMQCFLQTYTSKECIVCHPMLQQIYLNALQPERALIEQPKQEQTSGKKYQLSQIISENLHKKYMTSKDFYNIKIVNDIIYNEPTHIVAVFKDYLIYDDLSEFLKRSYDQGESVTRLPKICEFYEKYSKVFPNYVVLPESKMMYKNIERKQKIIDDKQRCLQAKVQMKEEKIKNKMKKLNGGVMPPEAEMGPIDVDNYESSMSWLKNSMRFFDTRFVDSVLKQDPLPSSNTQHSSFLQKSLLLDQSHRKTQNGFQFKNFADLDLDQLVQAFVYKDFNHNSMNQSNITATLDITMASFHQQDEAEKFVKSMLQQQQKQKEIIMRQMQQRKENQKLILTNNPKPTLLAQQQIGQVKVLHSQQQDQQKIQTKQQPQTVVTQSGQKFVFNTNGVNPYFKQQKSYFEKVKTDSKQRKSSQGNSIIQTGSPQLQPTSLIQSPPKAQQYQQIYAPKDIQMVKQISAQNQQTPVQQNREQNFEIKNNNIIKKKVKKVVPSVNLNHQQPDFKIKHGFNVPSNIAFGQLLSSQSGAITQRESLQKKLISNLVINQHQQQQNNFSPLDIQDLTTTNNSKKPKIFNYNIQDPNRAYQAAGSQSARVVNEGGYKKQNTSKLKQNISLSKDSRKQPQYNTIQQKNIQPHTAIMSNNLRSSNEYNKLTGTAPIISMKASSQDRDRYMQANTNKRIGKPELFNRIHDLIRGDSESNQRQTKPQSPKYYYEESKQIDISNTLQNQSNNHMHSYSNVNQQQLAQKFMNKRNSNKSQTQENHQQNNQAHMSSTISHHNSGYNSHQTNTALTLQQTDNSSNHTNNIMKVMSLDIADISTNLNNNSRNFLARQQQQQIQLQKQSRGMNPRQKSVPKNKKGPLPQQPHQNIIFIGEQNNPNLFGSQIHNMNNQSHIQQLNSGRQSPSTARNSNNQQNNLMMFDTNPVLNSQFIHKQTVIGSSLLQSQLNNNRYDSSNPIIQNNRQIVKKVLQNSKNSQIKSNSQNRARENSPMDYQVQLLGSTIQQDTTTSRIKPERQSLDRPAKIGLPYQQQINFISDNRDSSKRYSLKGPQSTKSPVIDQQSTSRTRQSSNNTKKIIIGKKTNIFGALVASKNQAGKLL